jgi:chemotaxis protein MotB
MLRAAAQEIRSAIVMDPQLRSLAAHMLIEEVPEGLRIQMVDGEGQALFATGVAAPNERGRALLLRAASVIARLPHSLEITGHTDAAPFRSGSDARSNWELSVERANAARRLLLDAGITERRVRAMTGRADQELLRPTEPLHPANRRVSVLVMINQVPDNSAATNARLAP